VNPAVAAVQIQEALEFPLRQRGHTWSEAFRRLSERAENLGVLVMTSGIVGSNTHRRLDPREFRGFALVDDYAPLIFVNGADTKAAQIFTLAHELVHVWLAESGLDDLEARWDQQDSVEVERWCNQVAAEVLVPLEGIRSAYRPGLAVTAELDRLAREYKVSTLVVLGRLYDANLLNMAEYRAAFDAELGRVLAILEEQESGGGGNFYNTQPVRTGKRFTRALIASTLEGRTLHRDAFRMLGLKKVATFHELAVRLGVA
jgi:Zn-dependent peptidase ImmA (M78 family)